MSVEPAVAAPAHTPTLHRTSCCRSLVSLLLRVHNMIEEGHLFSQEEKSDLLQTKLLHLLNIRDVCHSCTVAFTNLPMSSSSSLSSLSLSAEVLTPTLEYNFGEF